jgi:hypothetical protein
VRLDRQPAGGLGDVEEHVGAVVLGGLGERVQVDQATVGRLHRRDGYQRRAGVDRLRDPLQRHLADAHAARLLGRHLRTRPR